jgi:hypothetical protein
VCIGRRRASILSVLSLSIATNDDSNLMLAFFGRRIRHQTARFLPKKDSMKRILFVGGNYPYRHPEKRNTMLTILLEIIELKPETHPEKTWRIWKKRFYMFFLE